MSDGGPAFPYSPHTGNAGDDVPGMSLRDYFAAAVLGAIYHDGIGLGLPVNPFEFELDIPQEAFA